MTTAVIVSVIANVIVAALVNGNDAVAMADIVNGRAWQRRQRRRIAHGVDHVHDVVPVHERGHAHGTDHGHGPGYGHVLAAALLALSACGNDTSVIDVDLVTAPGSTLLDGVQTLRLVITNPRRVVTSERTPKGFSLAVELPADGSAAALLIDGLDAGGNVIASGASPRFAFSGMAGHVSVYMAAPDSIGVAPAALEPARSDVGTGVLAYGAIFVGGATSPGAPSDAVQIYNAFDHSLRSGRALPEARSGIAVGVGSQGVYLFGGRDEAGGDKANLWRFDPSQAPAGTYLDYGDKAGFARAGGQLIPLGNEKFIATGTPGAELSGLDGSMVARDGAASLSAPGITVTANDGSVASFFVGEAAVVRCTGSLCATLDVPGRAGASVVALPGGRVGIVCGGPDLIRIDAATATAETVAGIPSTLRSGCAVAVTARHLVIAGGKTATGTEGTVEVYDATTLEHILTSTLDVARSEAIAIALGNDQVLIASGVDAAGEPTATLELFTPSNP